MASRPVCPCARAKSMCESVRGHRGNSSQIIRSQAPAERSEVHADSRQPLPRQREGVEVEENIKNREKLLEKSEWKRKERRKTTRQTGSHQLKAPAAIAATTGQNPPTRGRLSDPGPTVHTSFTFRRAAAPFQESGFLNISIWPSFSNLALLRRKGRSAASAAPR